jgi:CheY-like chemotaxis protein
LVVAFSVTDTGIGIAPESLAAIFGAFQQGDGTLSRRYGGTGLGLSIASEVSALLGGRITAKSDLGRGSVFTLFLPAVLPEVVPDGVPDTGLDLLDEAARRHSGLGDLDALGLNLASLPGLLPGRGVPGPGAAAGPEGTPGVWDDGSLAAGSDDYAADAYLLQERSEPTAGRAARPEVSADRNVLVFEGSSGGLLSLLAHSAISDLAEISGTARVSTATSPGQAVALLAAEPFQCVVTDLSLPAVFDFLEQVQEKPELREIPVLAHAAGRLDAAARERLAALQAGNRTFELLPSLDELRERITLHLSAAQTGLVPALVGEEPAPAAESPGASHPGLRDKHVLVIDDDARNVFAITSTLEMHGVRVTCASDGRQGIDALLAAPGTDLILMDVMMPGMDGHTTIATIREMPQIAQLPIIAVTARAMPGDREKSLAAGANDYVTKPVDTDELLACMERWLAGS